MHFVSGDGIWKKAFVPGAESEACCRLYGPVRDLVGNTLQMTDLKKQMGCAVIAETAVRRIGI